MTKNNDSLTAIDNEKNSTMTSSDDAASCLSKKLWRTDGSSILFLMFLYVLQGIPLGLISAMPLLLTNNGISYADQAIFSFAFWPFSLKLLWAPFVDSLFLKNFGRRKSWLIPIQYLIGLFMIYISSNTDSLLNFSENDENEDQNLNAPVSSIQYLTFIFFSLNFFAATQDICVDGWCLTMLSKENVGWASTCNSVGQTAGWFIGNVVFLALESTNFSNTYFRPFFGLPSQDYALVDLSGVMFFFGCIFIVATTCIAIFKREKKFTMEDLDEGETLSVVNTYKILVKNLRKRLIILYIIYAMTSRIGFVAVDAISGLKMIENGMPKENLAMMAIPMIPIQICLPLLISKYTAGPRPMRVWIQAFAPRVILGLVATWICYQTKFLGSERVILENDAINNTNQTAIHDVNQEGKDYPIYWYAFIIFIYAIHQVFSFSHFVSVMAFHAKVSDPHLGGTSMTLMNTVSNLGGSWMSTVALFFVDKLSTFTCNFDNQTGPNFNNHGKNITVEDFDTFLNQNKLLKLQKSDQNTCEDLDGKFTTKTDGFYTEVLISTILGFVWLSFFYKYINFMDEQPPEKWHLKGSGHKTKGSSLSEKFEYFLSIFKLDRYDDDSDNRGNYVKLENVD